MWGELVGSSEKTIKLQQLEQFANEEWAKIPQDRCLKLVANYPKRLRAVIQQKDIQLTIEIGAINFDIPVHGEQLCFDDK